MVVIVRNPLDVIPSWLNLIALCNHNTKAPFDYEKEFPIWWDWWVKLCTKDIGNWFRQVMKDAALRKVPILWVRYEDLVIDAEPQLYNIMRFMLGQKDITGTNAERRIKEVVALGAGATRTYTLKDSTGKFNA